MKSFLSAGVVCLGLAAAAPGFAQTSHSQTVVNADGTATTTSTTSTTKTDHGGTGTGAVGGAVAGAIVAGPIGAVVGGVAGATVGHTVAPPSQVKTYVTTQTTEPVAYSGDIAVGRTVEGDVSWRDVPNYPKYSWAYLNGQRVVVDNESHSVVAVY